MNARQSDRRGVRQRALGFGAATMVFVAVQLFARPVFVGGEITNGPKLYLWAFTVLALLLCLVTVGVVKISGRVSPAEDNGSRIHYRSAVASGFWVAMAVALTFFALPGLRAHTALEAAYAVVTSSAVVALLVFSHLEFHSQGDE